MDGFLFQVKEAQLIHGGQRPLGEMEYKRNKAFPQIEQSKVSLGKVGDGVGSSSVRGVRESVSRSIRRAAKSKRWEDPKKPK